MTTCEGNTFTITIFDGTACYNDVLPISDTTEPFGRWFTNKDTVLKIFEPECTFTKLKVSLMLVIPDD